MCPASSTGSRRSQPKGDKRLRTRRKLLEATRELVREKGYSHTTMQDVAERAGMTSGAIYGNFKNRDELFLALAEEYWGPIHAEFTSNSTFAEKMQALAKATLEAVPERSTAAIGALSGRAYALSHPVVLERVRELTAKAYSDGAAWLTDVTRPGELPLPPDLLVRVIHALTDGLLFQKILTPELISDEVFFAAFSLFAGKASQEQDG
jgi:AcrR family transcriptional regulator